MNEREMSGHISQMFYYLIMSWAHEEPQTNPQDREFSRVFKSLVLTMPSMREAFGHRAMTKAEEERMLRAYARVAHSMDRLRIGPDFKPLKGGMRF